MNTATAQTTEAAASVHPFERAKLGQAPFRCVGYESTADREAANSHRRAHGQTYTTNMCGGTCEYCGTAIWDVYIIESADGRRFKVGSDCVTKTGQKALIARVKRKVDAKKRAAKAAKIAAELKAYLADETTRAILAAVEYSPAGPAHPAQTLLERAEWMSRYAGAAGRARAVKSIKSALAGE